MALFFLSTAISLLFMHSKTPLMMALTIVAQTTTVALSIYMIMSTSWLSFILFMVLVSAMMVIFVYVSSLASNDLLTLPHSTFVASGCFMLGSVLVSYFVMDRQETQDSSLLALTDMNSSPVMLCKIYAPYISSITVFLIVYLLVALIAVAKISIFPKGALRALKP